MYNELIKRLKEIHPEEFGDIWDFASACLLTMHEAADVIEELSARQKTVKIKIKKKTFGEIPNGTIFKPIGSSFYYMKIQPRDSINAIFANDGCPCSFPDDEEIEKVTYKLSEQGLREISLLQTSPL